MPEDAALPWTIPVAVVHREERSISYEADAAQSADLASALGIHAVDRLSVEGTAIRIGTHRVKVEISVIAEVRQLSVVSLEPVAQVLTIHEEEIFDETLDLAAEPGEIDIDPQAVASEDAALEDGHIPLGRLVQELIAVQLDPYPRAEGEGWGDRIEDADEKEAPTNNPFAALSALKSKEP